MANDTQRCVGSVATLWRYPVKSMMGEEVNGAELALRGFVGDRCFAVTDASTGKIVSAKNPKRWRGMFDFRAAYVEPPRSDQNLPAVRITLPDGSQISTAQSDIAQRLSDVLGRAVTLERIAPQRPSLEEYWPDMEGLDHRDRVTDEEILSKTFFDGAAVHLLTTATLDQLRAVYPEGRFEARRFRPNIVVATEGGKTGIVENDWIGHTVAIGERARLKIDRPCPRCVMTTLPQGDLPADTGVLRAAVRENEGNVGVYVSVIEAGVIRRGDSITLVD